jgi:hypothetical protein
LERIREMIGSYVDHKRKHISRTKESKTKLCKKVINSKEKIQVEKNVQSRTEKSRTIFFR